ncbi:hypothetical protein GOD03_17335 [Sinorhizobium medicae]|nr:hypothetical protein [Sinorhizobium medicae]
MRRNNSTFLQFRKRIPTDVLGKARSAALAVPVGDEIFHTVISQKAIEVAGSLRTRDPREAKERKVVVLSYLDSVWRSLREGPKRLTQKQIAALAGEVYRALVSTFEEDPGKSELWQKIVNLHASAMAGDDEAREKWFGPTVDQILAQHQLVVDGDSRAALLAAVGQALSLASVRLVQNAGGDYSPDTVVQRYPALELPKGEKPAPTVATSAEAGSDDPTIRKMAEKKLAMNGKGYATTEATETALRLFESVYGQKPMALITRREVADWIHLLQQKPTLPHKEHRSLGLAELVDLYAAQPNVRRLSGKSVNGHVSHLNSIWTWARKRGHVDRSLDNPFSEQRVEERLPPADEGFTPAQLQSIFDLSIFTNGERPPQGRGEAAFWLPLLLLAYGNRPEEMCQLLVSDVFFDKEEDIWCLRLTDEGTHPVKGSRSLKADGNPVIRRTLPIAKRLRDLGFIEYVESLKKAGELALFPKLTTKGKRGYLHSSFATWWGKYLRDNGAIPEVGNKPLRGFRDAWTTAAARSGLTEEEREWIQGHYVSKGKTSNRRYGVRDFGSKIDQISFKGLDLSRVRAFVVRGTDFA